MNTINLECVDSLSFYKNFQDKQSNEDTFRYEIMAPFKKMWDYLNAPMTPKSLGGYDVLMASEMLGIWTPRKSFNLIENQIDPLEQTNIFKEYSDVIETALARFTKINYQIPLDIIHLNILLGDPENKLLMASEGYSGFGGIPGFILLIVVPNDFNRIRLKSALAHELNHNIRFTYEPFNRGNISVEDYLVIEGLAEVFAESLYGQEFRGPWVQDYDEEEMSYTIEVMKDGRNVKGFEEVAAYMYGDEVATAQGYNPVGLSRNAGYTIGYHLVKAYLKNTGQTIEQATLTPTEIIVRDSKFFQ
ncbi:DUF2268 domain-containing protein [Vagococcus silagei]|uniref:DUF2268 domain-containing protein n=1 Tax=Vagococcus silagei TaxID=2508885 RepID=A0A4S3B2B5_9ENTE|nr:DUF2268 domain-containing protein [Vagococcus silagei]THB60942.1 hypothetical protein ESZ54_08225 [Vagococcus silagei]